MGLFTRIYALVISSRNKNFFIQRSNCTTKVCLVLNESSVSKTVLKYNCLVDFFTISLLNTHAHCRSLLKLDTKLDLVIDRFT